MAKQGGNMLKVGKKCHVSHDVLTDITEPFCLLELRVGTSAQHIMIMMVQCV